MKILLDTHMLDQKQTGNERYWKNLSEVLEKFKKVEIIKYNLKPNNGLYRIFFGFNQTIKRFKPDILHVQNFTPIKKTLPIINTVHDLCFKSYPQFFSLKSNLAFNYFFERSLKLSDAIICDSENTKNGLLNSYKINPKKIFVIYGAADKCFYWIKNKKEVKEKLFKKFKIKNDYFLVVGNIEKRKMSDKIVEVFGKFNKVFPGVDLILVGHNKLRIKENKSIKILGYVSDYDLNYLYNGAISLIYLSFCEGFGLPLVEAMATKTPIVCSDIPVFKEVVEKNNALFIRNEKELFNSMKIFLENNLIRDKYSVLSYKRSKFFSWEKTAWKTIKIYESVLKPKS